MNIIEKSIDVNSFTTSLRIVKLMLNVIPMYLFPVDVMDLTLDSSIASSSLITLLRGKKLTM